MGATAIHYAHSHEKVVLLLLLLLLLSLYNLQFWVKNFFFLFLLLPNILSRHSCRQICMNEIFLYILCIIYDLWFELRWIWAERKCLFKNFIQVMKNMFHVYGISHVLWCTYLHSYFFTFSFSIYILFYLCNAYGNCADYENVGYVGKEEG